MTQPSEQPLDPILVSRQDLADTACFLDSHTRPSDRSACDGCEDWADSAFAALHARGPADTTAPDPVASPAEALTMPKGTTLVFHMPILMDGHTDDGSVHVYPERVATPAPQDEPFRVHHLVEAIDAALEAEKQFRGAGRDTFYERLEPFARAMQNLGYERQRYALEGQPAAEDSGDGVQ